MLTVNIFSKDNSKKLQSLSCEGRIIAPLGSDDFFPNWNEISHSLVMLRRFCGQQIDFDLDWNVLKHSLAVALLSEDFLVGLLHDYSEMFTNDTPTPYKTDAQREFEHKCTERLAKYLEDHWVDFRAKEDFLDIPYKSADSIMLDVEARYVIQASTFYHKKMFAYDEKKYNKTWDISRVEGLYKKLVKIPSKQIFIVVKKILQKLDSIFRKEPYDKKIVSMISEKILEVFDIEQTAENYINNVIQERKVLKMKKENKKEEKTLENSSDFWHTFWSL